MKERAIVVKTAGKTALLRIEKHPECESCKVCAFRSGKSTVKVKAKNTVGAKAGDEVIVQAEKDNRLLASFIVYIIPVLLAGRGCDRRACAQSGSLGGGLVPDRTGFGVRRRVYAG